MKVSKIKKCPRNNCLVSAFGNHITERLLLAGVLPLRNKI